MTYTILLFLLMPGGTKRERDNRYLLKNFQRLPIAYKAVVEGWGEILPFPRNCSAVSLSVD